MPRSLRMYCRPQDRRPGSQLHAFIHVADSRLYSFLLHHALSTDRPRLEFFNIYERGARSFLSERGDHLVAPDSVLVIGGGQLGMALVSLMAREHFAARVDAPGLDKLRIQLVDQVADARVQLLRDRYSRLDDACVIVPLELDVASPSFDHLLESSPELSDVGIAYVCFDDDNLTVATTLNLLDQARGRFPIVARVSHRSAGLATMLESGDSEYADSALFRPLSLAQSCRGDIVMEGIRGQLARQVHEEYRRGRPGGPYDVPWKELPDSGRDRNLRHAASITAQIRSVGYELGPLIDWGVPPATFDPAEIERMAELEHERWVEERTRDGWRLGNTRNDGARTHPDLIDWEELPADRQDIDRRLISARPAMLAAIGIELYRG